MRITNTGDVGIGTTTPAYKLDVNGSARATSLNITGATGQIAIQDRLSSSSINLYISGGVFAFNNGTSDIFQLGNTGNVALYGALYGTSATFNNSLSVGSTVGSLGGWTNVTFNSTWTNYGLGYQTCQYRRFGDFVMLRGVFKWVANPTTTTVFQLPIGLRPTAGKITYIIRVSHATKDTATIEIDTSGNVICNQGGTSYLFFSFDGVTFSIS